MSDKKAISAAKRKKPSAKPAISKQLSANLNVDREKENGLPFTSDEIAVAQIAAALSPRQENIWQALDAAHDLLERARA